MNGQLGRQSVYSIYALETNQHSLISHIAGELEFWVPQHSLASHFAQLLREKSFMCRLASFRTC